MSTYLSVIAGVGALMTSWYKIFKPHNHLSASSLESAEKNNMLWETSEKKQHQIKT